MPGEGLALVILMGSLDICRDIKLNSIVLHGIKSCASISASQTVSSKVRVPPSCATNFKIMPENSEEQFCLEIPLVSLYSLPLG